MKALSGVATSGQTDSGVSARLFGSLLTWLNDHESDVFFIATCNDISKLPPEFSRAERFDGIFFLDLPDKAEKEAIWRIYLTKFGIQDHQPRPDDTDWTGAEIRSCCRLARLLGTSLQEAARNIVPVAVTAAESVERLRDWASGRCLSANEPGVFLEKQEQRRVAGPPVPQEAQGVRFSARSVKAQRARLGLSAKDFGRLIGVAALTIYSWESGKSRPRRKQLPGLNHRA